MAKLKSQTEVSTTSFNSENDDQVPIEERGMVDPIDQGSHIEFDHDELVQEIMTEKARIDVARSVWIQRKMEFLHQWDDFVEYEHVNLLNEQKYIHIPVTFEKIQAWHARMYKTIFAMDPVFTIRPFSKATKDEVTATKLIMEWYLREEINEGQGLKPVLDELIWDLGTDGWGCIYKRWDKKVRLSREIDPGALREELTQASAQIRSRGRPKKPLMEFKEISKLVTAFDGITLQTLPHENVYFPEYIPTSSDLNYPWLVGLELLNTEQDLIMKGRQGFYEADAVAEVIKMGKGYDDQTKTQLKLDRERLSGTSSQPKEWQEQYQVMVWFLRKDLDGDGYPEEYAVSMSHKARKILKIAHLDKFCKDGNRPIYKFDLIKRPRSAYSRGFPELLYSLQTEIDDFHNIRRANGLISSVPWGFYRASSGLEKEILSISAGKFYPVDDPKSDVEPMRFPNSTSWALQEEQLGQSYADKLTSMPSLLQGQMSGPVGPLRSTSGVNTLLNESSAPMDIYLDRFRTSFGLMLQGILSDLQQRLPDTITIQVLGDRGDVLFDQNGQMREHEINKTMMMGKYKFSLAANDAQYNPEKERQDALTTVGQLMTQFNIQMGIVTPMNAYYAMKDVLETSGKLDPDLYITKPPGELAPMNLAQEYTTICNGRVPMLVLHDDHAGKIAGLTALFQSPEYAEGKMHGNVSPLADQIAMQVINDHSKFMQVLNSLPASQGAQAGSQLPAPTSGGGMGQNPGQTLSPVPMNPSAGQPSTGKQAAPQDASPAQPSSGGKA